MANKYTRKGREAAPQTDEFVTFWEKAWRFLEPHLRNVAIGAGVLVVIVTAVWIISWARNGVREDATAMFARAVKIHDAELLPEDGTKDAKDKDKQPAADEDEVPRFKSARERAEATLAELDKLQKAHGSTAVAEEARAYRSGVLFELGRFDEARKAAQQFAAGAGKTDPLRTLTRESEGLALESQGKLDEALAVYKELADRGGDFFRERALYDQARVLARKGDFAGARDLYKKILVSQPAGLLHDEVQNRLALLGG